MTAELAHQAGYHRPDCTSASCTGCEGSATMPVDRSKLEDDVVERIILFIQTRWHAGGVPLVDALRRGDWR